MALCASASAASCSALSAARAFSSIPCRILSCASCSLRHACRRFSRSASAAAT
eukprot:CAMPEP_0182583042 /NCGR_PEP_ID=MMETSP1324-20130603/54136_1 /TAXON_ID=236786 /ORGANISM="Florenciella sp., Strain RCC1587" /LENGTH=52 /DNA_ID=CAMNT_0024799571 /DNA_START=12 /DNA_END=166 /DNA_ORIENTATION=-